MSARRGLRRAALLAAALLLGCAGAARAERLVTEVLAAGYRDAGELAAVLRPLVPPPGSVSGFNGQLIVRTTPELLDEVRRVLASLDRAPANLEISVRRTLDAVIRRDLATARARAGGDVSLRAGGAGTRRGAELAVRGADAELALGADRRHTTRRGDEVQTLRVLEGSEAWIHTGESVPVGERSVVVTGSGLSVADGVRYEQFGSGFYVRPRLNGDVVTLDVLPSRRERRGGGGGAQVQEAATSVSGRLGRWIEIGGTHAAEQRRLDTPTSNRSAETRRDEGIYVKVERLD